MREVLFLVGLAVMYMSIALGWRLMKQSRLRGQWDLGRMALERGDLEAAADAYKKCVGMAPLWGAARTLLAGTLARLGKTDEAEREARMAADLHPRDPESWRGLCQFYALFMPDRAERARDALDRLRELDAAAAEALLDDPRMARLRRNLDASGDRAG